MVGSCGFVASGSGYRPVEALLNTLMYLQFP